MLKIIFQDENLIILDKPSGVITISDVSDVETIATLVAKEFSIPAEISIVHRLDKDTSGVLVIAKDKLTHEKLQEGFKERSVKKEYLALVHGKIEKKGIVTASLIRVPGGGNKFVVDNNGRLASTEYDPIKQYGQFTLLKCKPLTGRTHQIRVHLKYINHPIVSDSIYAGRKTFKLDIKWCTRLFLHASKLGFNHPVSGKWVEFESSLPENLKEVLDLLDVKS